MFNFLFESQNRTIFNIPSHKLKRKTEEAKKKIMVSAKNKTVEKLSEYFFIQEEESFFSTHPVLPWSKLKSSSPVMTK